jgi:hypothetical protein
MRSIYVYAYHAILRVDTRQVDLVLELDGWWLIRIFVTAVHREGVDAVLVNALRGYGSVWIAAGGTGTYVGRT